jgi:protease-4
MNNRLLVWIFASFALGFGLPVLACSGLIVATGIALGQMSSGLAAPVVAGGSGPGVAVIPVEGAIVSGSVTPFTTGIAASADLIDEIQQANDDFDAKAIVLVVNSPGGSVVASDEIYHALTQVDKPVVVYMGETAASGGYYISMAAEWIVANPNTLTGSIGVITQFAVAEELLDEWGIEFITIKSGAAKDTGSPFRDMTDEERARWQALVDEVYDGFVQVVVEGRGLDEAEVRRLADGSVYTGRQALEFGLIDALGYEEDAIAKAAELGGISGTPRIIRYVREPTFYDLLGAATSARTTLPTPQDLTNWLGWPSLMFEYR